MAFDPITAIANVANTVLGRVLPDKPAQDQAKIQLLQMQLTGELQQLTGQLEVNKTEAASNSIFVAGWRPYIGWICGTGLGYQFLARPILQMFMDLTIRWHPATQMVNLDMGTLIALLTGMLGLGAARTIEKVNGVANGH